MEPKERRLYKILGLREVKSYANPHKYEMITFSEKSDFKYEITLFYCFLWKKIVEITGEFLGYSLQFDRYENDFIFVASVDRISLVR